MGSYTVEWTRPTFYLDNAGQGVSGFQVRITMHPWNEARDIVVKDDTPEAIKVEAEKHVLRREALDKLKDVEVKAPKKKSS